MGRRGRGDVRATFRTVIGGNRRRLPAAGRTRRRWPVGVAAVALGVVIYAGITQTRRASHAPRLPALPDLSAGPKAIGEHVRDADRRARMNPASAAAVEALCLAYHADMFYDQAGECYAVAEGLSPRDLRWMYYRALAQSERGASDALADGMRRVVAVAPDFGPAWWRLGEAEFKEGRYDRAEEAWRRAMASPEPQRMPPAGSPPHVAAAEISVYAALGLGRVALARGDADDARQILESVILRAPSFGPAFSVLADAYTALDRVADAGRAGRTADRLPAHEPYADPMVDALVRESRSSTFLLQQAAVADINSNAAWREYLIRRALEFDPDNPDVVFELGTILRRLGRHDEALALLRRHQHMVPGDFQSLAEIGRCLAGLRRFAEAESFLRRALQGIDDAVTHYDRGVVLTPLGRPAEAMAEYQHALDRNPHHVEARNNLAVGLIRQGELEQAARELARVLEIDPEHADAHTNLGIVFASQGQPDRAAQEFQEALRLNPEHTQAREGLRRISR